MKPVPVDQIEARFKLDRGDFHLNVELQIPGRGITALFGPSGCGKTTLLRAVAGLESCRAGYLRIGDQIWQDDRHCLPTHRRPLGYVFQEASLFEHLSVRGNLDYARRRQRAGAPAMDLDQVVALLGLSTLIERRPAGLSGGERQRVAIARALLAAPRLLLMDEPLAALDASAKHAILPFLERLHDELDIPLLYISHDPDEVARLADHLVLMGEGKVVATGPTAELFTRLDLPLAHAGGAKAMVEAEVIGHDDQDQLTELRFSGGHFLVPRSALAIGQKVRLRVLAKDVSLTLQQQTGTSILNIFPVTVTELAEESPAQLLVRLDAAGTPLLARLTRRSARTLQLTPGRTLFAQVKTAALLA